MIWVTDALNGAKVAINPEHIVAVFVAQEGEMKDKTIVNLINGQIVAAEDDLTIVGMLQAK
jgi:uncharacterized protein YlzI (FlbEa/FlbD family)